MSIIYISFLKFQLKDSYFEQVFLCFITCYSDWDFKSIVESVYKEQQEENPNDVSIWIFKFINLVKFLELKIKNQLNGIKMNKEIVNNENNIELTIKKHKTCNLSEQFANAINKVFFW